MESDELLAALPLDISIHLEAGYRLWRDGEFDAAQAQLEEAQRLAVAAGHLAGQLAAAQLLGNLAYDRGDLEAARRRHATALERCRALDLAVGVASSLHNLGLVAARMGDMAMARTHLIEAASTYVELGRSDRAADVRSNLLLLLRNGQARSVGGE
jgi:hypothetical protein